MKKIFSLLALLILFSCSTSKYSLPDKYPLTHISSDKGIELYQYRSSIGNTCIIGIMPSKDDPKITYISGILSYEFLNSMSSLDKRKLENDLNDIIKDYVVAIIDDKIMFMDNIKEKLTKIPQGILFEKVKKVGEFTCSYAALLEELMKKGNNLEEE
ncbi:MAG: hypothetical protein N2560_09020 [Ignavibacteria bacterium]|nr:hypothetical protein [Ignavibacteria bacterium]